MPYFRPISAALTLLIIAGGLATVFVVALQSGWKASGTSRAAYAQGDCTEVLTLGPETENQSTDPFEIAENSFRVSGEVSSLGEDPPRLQISPLDETGQPVSFIPSYDEGPFDQLVLAGPGTFTLNISGSGVEYTLTVEDCVAPPPGEPGDEGTSLEFTLPPPTPAPPPSPQPAPPSLPRPDPPPASPPVQDGALMKAGGPEDSLVPLMPNGKCPREFPMSKDNACYR